MSREDYSNSWYFRKYKRMTIQHQQFLWTKKQHWQKKRLIQVKVVFLSTKTVDAVLSSFCIFESIKNWDYPSHKFFFSFNASVFFVFHFFFQPEGPRLFMWKDVAKLNMACFNSRISFPWQVEKNKNEGKRSPINIFCSP